MYQHPSYQRPTSLNNDIAVFELEKPIQFNKYVQPVCLPDKDVAVGSDCYITGTLDQNEISYYKICVCVCVCVCVSTIGFPKRAIR